MNVLPYGDRAVLVEIDDVLALTAALRANPPPGTVDIVPAAHTVLVRSEANLDVVHRHILALDICAAPDTEVRRSLEFEVTYDGADLAEVSTLTGLSPAEVIARHTASRWTVGFCGFSPGFGYLVGGDPALAVPRRASPRTRVPAGSVALAGEYSAIYPRESPGGWQLIGRTDAVVWDVDSDPPTLLDPGTRVRFRAGPG
jgi:KipI family sensor histidine kinase inhibitor